MLRNCAPKTGILNHKAYEKFRAGHGVFSRFEYSNGKIIITMDADLQNDPLDIPDFITKMDEGFEIVSGWRYERKDPLTRKLVSSVANLLIWGKQA